MIQLTFPKQKTQSVTLVTFWKWQSLLIAVPEDFQNADTPKASYCHAQCLIALLFPFLVNFMCQQYTVWHRYDSYYFTVTPVCIFFRAIPWCFYYCRFMTGIGTVSHLTFVISRFRASRTSAKHTTQNTHALTPHSDQYKNVKCADNSIDRLPNASIVEIFVVRNVICFEFLRKVRHSLRHLFRQISVRQSVDEIVCLIRGIVCVPKINTFLNAIHLICTTFLKSTWIKLKVSNEFCRLRFVLLSICSHVYCILLLWQYIFIFRCCSVS